jgi:hypothetical protein
MVSLSATNFSLDDQKPKTCYDRLRGTCHTVMVMLGFDAMIQIANYH